MTKKKIIIATGGTGGHVFPALSLAKNLEEKYNVILTTDNRGYNLLKSYKNINLIKIPSSPLIKKNIFKFFLSTLAIIYSLLKSLLFLIFFRPSIVVGMGGYSSFPVCIAAYILRIKFTIYENNLIIGKANRYLLPFTEKIFVSFKELEGINSKYSKKIFEVGNIVRQEILNLNFTKEKNDKFDNLNILVLGGSQGAKIFAEELPQIFKKLNNSQLSIKVFQQCLKSQNDQLSSFYEKTNIKYEIFNFTDKITDYYLKSNIVITRAGASVLGELINVKIPFISIPLPSSADNHQQKNAEFYKKKGFGYLLDERDMKNNLYDLINLIFKKKLFLDILHEQRKYSNKGIFNIFNNQLEKIINEKN